MATIERSVFTSLIFAEQGKRILNVKAEYSALEYNDRGKWQGPKVSEIVAAENNNSSQSALSEYWIRWGGYYDYLLVLYTQQADANPLPNKLTLIYQGNGFQLYKLNKANAFTG